jgi:hypothetical protein
MLQIARTRFVTQKVRDLLHKIDAPIANRILGSAAAFVQPQIYVPIFARVWGAVNIILFCVSSSPFAGKCKASLNSIRWNGGFCAASSSHQ